MSTTFKELFKSTGRLISGTQLAKLGVNSSLTGRIVFIDASWYLPNNPRNGLQEFLTKRIKLPSSTIDYRVKYADVDGIKDKSSSYPHMLPSVEGFNEAASLLGIRDSDTVIVYDNVGHFSAPRIAWMLEVYQNSNTLLLDTFPEYLASLEAPSEGVDTTEYKSLEDYYAQTAPPADSAFFQASKLDSSRIISFEELKDIVTSDNKDNYLLLDARSTGRFLGTEPEPRAGLSNGHVPGARSVPFTEVISSDNFNKFKSPEELAQVFKSHAGIEDLANEKRQLIVMCGTGVTACVLERALRIAGSTQSIKVYDGSWT